jgi:hypothetical protein
MVDERANKASAGAAKRQPRRGGPVMAARAAEKPDLDARERRISPRRKAMGPTQEPADARPVTAGRAPAEPPDEPSTDLD